MDGNSIAVLDVGKAKPMSVYFGSTLTVEAILLIKLDLPLSPSNTEDLRTTVDVVNQHPENINIINSAGPNAIRPVLTKPLADTLTRPTCKL